VTLGALVIAGVLVPFRDHLPNADMALALVVPVLLAAIVGGRIAGASGQVVLDEDGTALVPVEPLQASLMGPRAKVAA